MRVGVGHPNKQGPSISRSIVLEVAINNFPGDMTKPKVLRVLKKEGLREVEVRRRD